MILGIAGVARAGKDTLYQLLSEKIPCERQAFADSLKVELHDFVLKMYKIDIFSCSAEEKEIIRPIMVTHNKIQKRLHGRDYFVDKLEEKIKPSSVWSVICDVRYDYEAEWIQVRHGKVIHLSKLVNGKPLEPANEEELNNDFKVRKKSDLVIEWPESPSIKALDPHVLKVINFLNAKTN